MRWVPIALLLLAGAVHAQDKRIERKRLPLLVGQYVDFESGSVLSRPCTERLVADVRLLRRGNIFELVPVGGATALESNVRDAPAGGYDAKPRRIEANRSGPTVPVWFVRTAAGHYARVQAITAKVYGSHALALAWDFNTAGTREFPETGTEVRVEWVEGVLEVSWKGPDGRYRVESGEASAQVSGHVARLAGLERNRLHEVRVYRLLESGLRSAPAVASCFAGPRRIVRGKVSFPGRWYQRGGGLNVRGMKAFAEDADAIFYMFGVFSPGGGIWHVGRGEAVFKNLRKFGSDGYWPAYQSLQEADVFALRTADGRYAKIMIEGDGGGRDYRYGMNVHVVFLAGGGNEIPPPPEPIDWEQVKGGVRLGWEQPRDALEFEVRAAGGTEALYRGEDPYCTLELERNRLHSLEVSAIYPHKVESEPALVDVHTYPPRYRIGTITLDCWGRSGYSFTKDKLDRADAEFYIARAAGGAHTLTLAAPKGIGKAGDNGFGEFPEPGWNVVSSSFVSDQRQPKNNWFFLLTSEGGIASVRVKKRMYPNVLFEYIYAAPLWSLSSVRLKGNRLEWGELPKAKFYRVSVNGREAVTTEKTYHVIENLSRNSFHTIELSAVLDDGTETETLQLTKHTFSKNFRFGRMTIAPLGSQACSLATGTVTDIRGKYDLMLRMISRTRVRVLCPNGFELQPHGALGDFPAIGAAPRLEQQRDIELAEAQKGVLLVKTKDGGWASVKAKEITRWQSWRIEYLYSKPISMEVAVEAVTKAAENPSAEESAEIDRLLTLLREDDPRARNLAVGGLTRLGLRATRQVLELRETTKEPDLRRLLDRWIAETYERKLR